MAELHVQPKQKKRSVLPWLFVALALAALTWLIARSGNHTGKVSATSTEHNSTSTTNSSHHGNTAVAGGWESVDLNAPAVKYEEITRQDIDVRSNGNYSIYGMGENILFDEGKATIRPDAEANLKEIAGSIGKRYNGGDIRVYGFTDAQGTAGNNKELAQQRADAVKSWMQNNGITSERISVNAIGEGQPVATNSTEAGRQQNRRVQIVARGGGASAGNTESQQKGQSH